MIYAAAGREMDDSNTDAAQPASKFSKLLEDAAQQLYPGCEKFSKLSLIVELFQIKCLFWLSDKAIESILNLIKRALPSGETLPETFYGAKKLIRDLGLRYEKIHACENDCMLFWKQNEKAESCLVCGESRWKSVEGQKVNGDSLEKCAKKIPRKVLRYFPLKPRLQRLFMSSEINLHKQLRQIGVSSRKASYLHDLAKKYINGILSDEKIVQMDDRSLFTILTMVNGIGSWSVHMFMIFSLHRPDVLPIHDQGIRRGLQKLYALEEIPRPSRMDQLCEKWKPCRSVASWYIWRYFEAKGEILKGAVVENSDVSLQQQQHLQFLDPISGMFNVGACAWGQ